MAEKRKALDMATKLRHRRVFKHVVEEGRKLGEAIKMEGYSDAVATAPTKITKTRSWKELVDEYLSDELLTKTHNELIKNKDANIRTRAVEMGYKVKKRYSDEAQSGNVIVVLPAEVINRAQKEPKVVENQAQTDSLQLKNV